MWTRKELKDKAKAVLKKNYWSALGVSIVIALAGGNDGWSSGGGSSSTDSDNFVYSKLHDSGFISWKFATFALIVVVAIMALRIFIGYSLEVGGKRYFVKSAQYKNNEGCFSFGFSGQNYIGIVKTMFLTNVFIFLWTLLLIIPGIIKSYAYRMVPYILEDNPNIGAQEAIALSNEMTRGHKFDMFVLDLSFIGWYILGALALGIGIFFVMPYENATKAELYLVLRKDAINNNLCRREDLLLAEQVSDDNNNMY